MCQFLSWCNPALVAQIYVCPLMAHASLLLLHLPLSSTGRSIVHSNTHLAITRECFTHSLHSRDYLRWTTKSLTDSKYFLSVVSLSWSPILNALQPSKFSFLGRSYHGPKNTNMRERGGRERREREIDRERERENNKRGKEKGRKRREKERKKEKKKEREKEEKER